MLTKVCNNLFWHGFLGVSVLLLGQTATSAGEPEWVLRTTIGPSPRAYHGMAYDNDRGVTVLFGGLRDTTHWGDTWEWDGSTWVLAHAEDPSGITAPAPREHSPLAYDSVRRVTVLFGGHQAGIDWGDTWEWDGNAWHDVSPQPPASSPSPRGNHALAFDSVRGVCVLFGGFNKPNDTWEWNGSTWTQRASSGPSGRHAHRMVYDRPREVTVLFGGYDGNMDNETWEWNGNTATWTQRFPPVSPPPRLYHAMAYDSAQGVTVLFGGGFIGDTWEWDGSTGMWTQRFPPVSPSPRDGPAAAYDIAREATVLFGGNDGSYEDDTWEYGFDCNNNGIPDGCDLSCGLPGGPCDMPGCGQSEDCNSNGLLDDCDTASGSAGDCDSNGTPDECELADADCNTNDTLDGCDILAGTSQDCNTNAMPDDCDIAAGTSADCNGNEIPDECDIAGGTSSDCDGTGIPDECEFAVADCNTNGVLDGCDILAGTSEDCNTNMIPDECEPDRDCNYNGVADICDLVLGTSEDCNGNTMPDECDVALIHDCCGTGHGAGCSDPVIKACVCDEDRFCCDSVWDQTCVDEVTSLGCGTCQITSTDCNTNGVPDECETDCNANDVPDECDVAAGTSQDCNSNGIPDECEPDFDGDILIDECDPDIDEDGIPNEPDVCDYTPLGAVNIIVDPTSSLYGTIRRDLDGDCDCDLADFAKFTEDGLTGPNG